MLSFTINAGQTYKEEIIKKFRPTSILITNYINWTLQHVGNLNKTLKNIK